MSMPMSLGPPYFEVDRNDDAEEVEVEVAEGMELEEHHAQILRYTGSS